MTSPDLPTTDSDDDDTDPPDLDPDSVATTVTVDGYDDL